MEIQTTAGALDAARKRIAFADNRRVQLPILRCLVFEADKDGIYVSITDLEVSALTSLEGTHTGTGRALVPITELTPILRGIGKNEPASIRTLSGGKVSLRVGKVERVLPFFDLADYPEPSVPGEYPSDETVAFDGEELRTLLRSVIPAASDDPTRPILCGVYLTAKDGQLEAVATDSYRLHRSAMPCAEELDVIIPARVLKPLAKGKDEEVDLAVVDGVAHLFADGVYTMVRCIEGQIPNWRQLVHNGDATVGWTGERDEWLKGALAIDAAVGKTNVPMRVLHHDRLKDHDLLWCIVPDVGETSVPVKRTNTLIEPADAGYQFGINPRYVADALACFRPGEVAFEQKNALCPLHLRQWNSDASELLVLIMPMRIADKGCETHQPLVRGRGDQPRPAQAARRHVRGDVMTREELLLVEVVDQMKRERTHHPLVGTVDTLGNLWRYPNAGFGKVIGLVDTDVCLAIVRLANILGMDVALRRPSFVPIHVNVYLKPRKGE
jgi:DNA polymerase-3 subunit beta